MKLKIRHLDQSDTDKSDASEMRWHLQDNLPRSYNSLSTQSLPEPFRSYYECVTRWRKKLDLSPHKSLFDVHHCVERLVFWILWILCLYISIFCINCIMGLLWNSLNPFNFKIIFAAIFSAERSTSMAVNSGHPLLYHYRRHYEFICCFLQRNTVFMVPVATTTNMAVRWCTTTIQDDRESNE